MSPNVFRIVLATCWMASVCAAEEAEWRQWTSAAGTTIEARVAASANGSVTLEKRDGSRITVTVAQLSADDQQYLAARTSSPPASPPAAETPAPPTPPSPGSGTNPIAGVEAQPGAVSHEISCQADPKWSYQVYLPRTFQTGRLWPVLFVMAPGGGSSGILQRYIPASDQFGLILAVSRQSKNDFADSQIAMMAMLTDVESRFPVCKQLLFSSGMSGGSRMAYLMAETDKRIAGVLACGSGSGVYIREKEFHQAKLRRDLVVCSLLGTNDYNRREVMASHKEFGKESRFIWFPGRHDWAAPELITEGLGHIYGTVLAGLHDKSFDPWRAAFVESQWKWAKEREASAPWITHTWAAYLSRYPASGPFQREAAAALSRLGADAKVKLAIKAQKAIDSFSLKYLGDNNTTVDKSPDPERLKAAEKEAAEFMEIPHAEILKRLGQPAA